MDKITLLNQLISDLENTLEVLVNSANEAREAATNEESKAENKYDTRGLEASYLAGAQAKRADELKFAIEGLSQFKKQAFPSAGAIALGHLVAVLVDGSEEKHFFLLPFGGGQKLKLAAKQGQKEIFVVTPDAPLGKNLIGRQIGDDFELKTVSKVTDYEIVKIL